MDENRMINQTFGKWKVIRYHHKDKHWHKHFLCRCECGAEKVIDGYKLIYKTTQGCHKCNAPHSHRMSYSRLYSIWTGMKGRCYNDNNKAYKNYGSRGIKICDEWQIFEPFYDWAMKNGYTDSLTIERKNVNGDYCPENCCWIPLSDQMKNTTRSVFITYDGQTKNQKEWASEIGISQDALRYRIKRHGVEKALTMKKGR